MSTRFFVVVAVTGVKGGSIQTRRWDYIFYHHRFSCWKSRNSGIIPSESRRCMIHTYSIALLTFKYLALPCEGWWYRRGIRRTSSWKRWPWSFVEVRCLYAACLGLCLELFEKIASLFFFGILPIHFFPLSARFLISLLPVGSVLDFGLVRAGVRRDVLVSTVWRFVHKDFINKLYTNYKSFIYNI